jgi:hypothetical protein
MESSNMSAIDPSKPEAGFATTASVRFNFAAAAIELDQAAAAIGDNAAAILVNQGNIGDNGADIATNAAAILVNQGNIGDNAAGIADNAAAILVNQGDIGDNAAGIGANAAAILVNQGDIAGNTSAILERQMLSEKAAINGYCPLDNSALVPIINIPITNLTFMGGWDAAPGLLPAAPTSGNFWVISNAGTLTVVPPGGTTPTPTAMIEGDYLLYADSDGYFYQIKPNFDLEDARYLQLAGGILTGPVDGVPPVEPEHLTRKDFVDAGDAAALAAAAAAQGTADTALANAATADGKAVAAHNAADAAQVSADAADGKAVAAQGTADTALANAATADGKAVAAQSTADGAAAAAAAAQGTANAAMPKAGGAFTGVVGLVPGAAAVDALQKAQIDQAIADAIAAIPPPVSLELPVGAMVLGYNPTGLLPGTWVQLPEGTFLMNTVAGAAPAGGSNDAVTVAHGHAVTDPGHGHAVVDPTHTHTVVDPMHSHSFDLKEAGASAAQAGGESGATVNSQATTSVLTGITNAVAATGVSVTAGPAGVTVNSGGSGVTVGDTGTPGAGLNRPLFEGVAIYKRTA